MTLMRFDPFRELDRLGERVLAGGLRAMPTEAFRRGDEFFVLIDLPGADLDNIDVTVERNVVKVHSTRTSPRQEGDELLVDERPHGQLSRQFFLGDNLDAAKLHANYDRGVLTLTIPVAAESKPRQIKIGSAEGQSGTAEIDAGSRSAQNEQQPANA
jgi:HSP20 family protein